MSFQKKFLEVTLTYVTLALILQTQGSPTDLKLKSGSLNVPAKNVKIPSEAEAVVHKDPSTREKLDKTAATAEPLSNISASGAANFEILKYTKNTLAPKVRNKKCFWPSFYDDYYVPPPYPGSGPFGPMYPPMRGPPPYPFF